MSTLISVYVDYGNSSVSAEDTERASIAASRILDGADTNAAYDAFLRQMDGDDWETLTGAAKLWYEAQQAADCALTEGWLNPEGASCSIYPA